MDMRPYIGSARVKGLECYLYGEWDNDFEMLFIKFIFFSLINKKIFILFLKKIKVTFIYQPN